MRVLVLNYEYPPLGGGAANALYHVAEEFAKSSEARIDIVTSSAEGVFGIEELSANVRVHKLPIRKEQIHYWKQGEILDYSRRALPYARRLAANGGYDLCHAWFAMPCGYIAKMLRSKMPYIVSLRGSDVPGFNERLAKIDPLLKPFFKRVIRSASAVYANSEGLRDLAHNTMPGAPIEIIYNGVDAAKFAPRESKRPGETIKLISVCRLIERKGVGDIIAALTTIKERLGEVSLTVVGEGNLEDTLKTQARELSVDKNIDWLGYVEHDDLPDLYRQADIFLLPSHHEGMSNSLLEAMAAGLAVVVTDTGGTRELFRDNGRIIPAADPDSIAEAVLWLAKDREALARCSERSATASKEFTWRKVAEKYNQAYKRAAR